MSVPTQRILLVDDDPLILEHIRLHLSALGYEVTTAIDGEQALCLIDQHEWDLVLLDIQLPDISGLEILRAIRQVHCLLSLPVIMVTSQSEREQIVSTMEAGANDYLIKPLDYDIALARIQTQLTCKNLAAAKDEFLAFASHDLKKPLMLMLDIARELLIQLPPGAVASPQVIEDLEYLIHTAERMTKVVEGFLNKETFNSGILRLDKRLTFIRDIVDEVVQDNEAYAGNKQIDLAVDHDAGNPAVLVDQEKIKEVVDNLVGNAIKFSPPGTRVVLRTRADADQVYLRVCDTGPGLNDDDLSKLFTKGATLSNRPTGNEKSSGLGLFLCRSMVQQHGGQIGAANNAEKGATFWISLPRKATASRRSKARFGEEVESSIGC
jgi:two-component system sensor histidine kinase/response regulator